MIQPWQDRLNPHSVGLPDEDTMSCEDGLVENHFYIDLRWVGLDDFDRFWTQEEDLLQFIEDGGDPEADEAGETFCDNEVYFLGLDPGVASSVAALAALGAVPFSSCTGGPGHGETHPLVAFWAAEEHIPTILDAADEVGVLVDAVSPSGLVAYTMGDTSTMRDFAQAIIRRVRATTG